MGLVNDELKEMRWGLIVNQRTPLAQTPQRTACFMVTICLVPVVEVCGMICCLVGLSLSVR